MREPRASSFYAGPAVLSGPDARSGAKSGKKTTNAKKLCPYRPRGSDNRISFFNLQFLFNII
ncbi:hypothetical protein B0I18_110178 [Taibaiella chishuiensis]|uniref:Uncharacterized protein n=1 Tax=Taibaiella chishuiensis TaxID=1434707 RepID=A0A2P8CY61_9BACT|nr:hypothetical protein B0I18_110178 [Taibaiella chishuiensis]